MIGFSYLFRSGNAEHPSDRFYNTTIEILPASAAKLISDVSPRTNTTNDGYLPIGKFDSTGLAYGTLDDPDYGKIAAIRLKVHGDSENWAILSEVTKFVEFSIYLECFHLEFHVIFSCYITVNICP